MPETYMNFEIPGQAIPWTVYTRRGKPHLGFEKMKAWQEHIRAVVRLQMAGKPLIEGPVALSMVFFLEWPRTAPQRDKKAMLRWRKAHLAMKPDISNLWKAAEDAIASVMFAVGDQQVIRIIGQKDFCFPPHTQPRTLITVSEMPA